MGTEPANDPASAQLDKGIGTAHSPADNRLIKDFGGTFLSLSPAASRRDQGFRFAGNPAAVPVGDGDKAGVSQASQPRNAMRNAVIEIAVWHQMLDGVDGADGHVGLDSGQSIHF